MVFFIFYFGSYYFHTPPDVIMPTPTGADQTLFDGMITDSHLVSAW